MHSDTPDSGVSVVNHDVQSPIRSTAIRVLYLQNENPIIRQCCFRCLAGLGGESNAAAAGDDDQARNVLDNCDSRINTCRRQLQGRINALQSEPRRGMLRGPSRSAARRTITTHTPRIDAPKIIASTCCADDIENARAVIGRNKSKRYSILIAPPARFGKSCPWVAV